MVIIESNLGNGHLKEILKIGVILFLASITQPLSAEDYSWTKDSDSSLTVENKIKPPLGFVRTPLGTDSFGYWLRFLPLKKNNRTVYLYNGNRKWNQSAQAEILDIDVGKKDLQQCADAVIRLRAEYFYSKKEFDSINFKFTSGDNASFRKWIEGFRPKVTGNKVTWNKTKKIDSSYVNFRRYLEIVFIYSGSYSLQKELKEKTSTCDIEPGDVFIRGGFPGHAVIVIDVAISPSNGKKVFLLAQSYMPAQDVHILKNKKDNELSPWYNCEFGTSLETPQWTFDKNQLMSFK